MMLKNRKLHNLSAAVLGSTGNIGKEIVKSLLTSRYWDSIVLINQRKLADVSIINSCNYKTKVKEYTVETDDIDRFENSCMGILSMEQCHTLFIAIGIGTERKLDVHMIRKYYIDIPTAFAKGAKQGTSTVKHVSLLAGIGVDKFSILSENGQSTLDHTIISTENLYKQLKIEPIENLINLSFPSLSIFRPTTLTGRPVLPKIIGDSMILDAQYMMLDDRDKVVNQREEGSVHWNGKKIENRGSKVLFLESCNSSFMNNKY